MAHQDRDRNGTEYFNRRFHALKKERTSFISHWKDLSRFVQPRRGRFFVTDHQKAGQPAYQNIINSRATQAHRTARAGLFAGVMSPSRPWHRLRVIEDPELEEFQPVKKWLQDVANDQRAIFNRGNLYNMAPQFLGEALQFGTGVMTHEDDFQDLARYYTHTAGSYVIAQDARMRVTTLGREFQKTTDQLVREYGLDNVSMGVKTSWDNGNYEAWHSVIQFIEPNPDADPNRQLSQFKAWRSVVYEPGNIPNGDQSFVNDPAAKILSRKGFNRFPGYTLRWETTGEDTYGTDCPAMTALGDIKMLQVEERNKAMGIEKQSNPPLVGPASLRTVPIDGLPGGVTLYDVGSGTQKLEALYNVQINLQELGEDLKRIERRIDEAFLVDMFLAITNMEGIQPKNELELSQRNAERLLQIGPPLQRIEGEFLEEVVDDTFQRQVDAGILPEAPPELQGLSLKVEFISSLAQAQRAVATSSIDDTAAFVTNLAQTYPEVSDVFDADEAVRERSSLIGVPAVLIVPSADVEETRARRAETGTRSPADKFGPGTRR